MNVFNNSLTANGITLADKVRELLEKPYKLVLVQQHELERLRNSKSKNKDSSYINDLYNHYIVQGKGKTYIKQ